MSAGLDFAVLADSAQSAGGKIYILGGGVNMFWTQQLPIPMPVVLAMQFLFDSAEIGSTHHLRVEVVDVDGNAIFSPLQADVPVPSPHPGTPTELPVNVIGVVPFPPVPVIKRPGAYAVHLLLDGNLLKTLPFHVVRGMPPTANA